jgi:hypothetical protein
MLGSAEACSGCSELVPPRCFRDRLGNPKVRHHRVSLGQHDVVGFDVAMHDAELVSVRECVDHVAQNPHGVADG